MSGMNRRIITTATMTSLVLIGYFIIVGSAVSREVDTEKGLAVSVTIVLSGGLALTLTHRANGSSENVSATKRLSPKAVWRFVGAMTVGGLVVLFFPMFRPGDIQTEVWMGVGALMLIVGGILPAVVTSLQHSEHGSVGAPNDRSPIVRAAVMALGACAVVALMMTLSPLRPVGGWAAVIGAGATIATLVYTIGHNIGVGKRSSHVDESQN